MTELIPFMKNLMLFIEKTSTPILLFRELLEKVPIWNSEIIESECSRIMNNSKCVIHK